MADHTPNEFSEAGFLTRLRHWRDIMPWLSLADCLSPATSLIGIALTLVALHIGSWFNFFLERGVEGHLEHTIPAAAYYPPAVKPVISANALPQELDLLAVPSVIDAQAYLVSPLRAVASDPPGTKVFLIRAMQQYILFVVWMFPAGYIMRRTALKVSQREQMSSRETIALIWQRKASFLAAPTLTLGVAMLCLLCFLILGWVDRVPLIGSFIATVGAWIGIVLVFLCGLLLLGTMLTLPMMWASIMIEGHADGFDAASRGFEYISQRPFRWVAYLVMGTLMAIVALNLISGVFATGLVFTRSAFSLGSGAENALPWGVFTLVSEIPLAIAFNLMWSINGVAYLLLRRDANHQDMEEVWEPPRPPAKPLPELSRTPDPQQ